MIGSHLREEHDELRGHIERLRGIADSIGGEPTPEIHEGVTEALQFLQTQLLPHAEVEERALYPVVARLLGNERATATMSEDHVAIGAYVSELSGLRARHTAGPPPLADLRRLLYSLHAIISLHLEKEERVFIPVLDAGLSEAESRELLARVERTAEEVFAER